MMSQSGSGSHMQPHMWTSASVPETTDEQFYTDRDYSFSYSEAAARSSASGGTVLDEKQTWFERMCKKRAEAFMALKEEEKKGKEKKKISICLSTKKNRGMLRHLGKGDGKKTSAADHSSKLQFQIGMHSSVDTSGNGSKTEASKDKEDADHQNSGTHHDQTSKIQKSSQYVTSEVIQVPRTAVEHIMGEGGENLTELMSSTGCKIQIGPVDWELPKTTCELTGIKDAINDAKKLIYGIIQRHWQTRAAMVETDAGMGRQMQESESLDDRNHESEILPPVAQPAAAPQQCLPEGYMMAMQLPGYSGLQLAPMPVSQFPVASTQMLSPEMNLQLSQGQMPVPESQIGLSHPQILVPQDYILSSASQMPTFHDHMITAEAEDSQQYDNWFTTQEEEDEPPSDPSSIWEIHNDILTHLREIQDWPKNLPDKATILGAHSVPEEARTAHFLPPNIQPELLTASVNQSDLWSDLLYLHKLVKQVAKVNLHALQELASQKFPEDPYSELGRAQTCLQDAGYQVIPPADLAENVQYIWDTHYLLNWFSHDLGEVRRKQYMHLTTDTLSERYSRNVLLMNKMTHKWLFGNDVIEKLKDANTTRSDRSEDQQTECPPFVEHLFSSNFSHKKRKKKRKPFPSGV